MGGFPGNCEEAVLVSVLMWPTSPESPCAGGRAGSVTEEKGWAGGMLCAGGLHGIGPQGYGLKSGHRLEGGFSNFLYSPSVTHKSHAWKPSSPILPR